jgi:hypothetical protein
MITRKRPNPKKGIKKSYGALERKLWTFFGIKPGKGLRMAKNNSDE